ncbi:hypothetical protein QTO34_007954 [Cnephaeus nilssonii]|uniref:IF rod domain-containing protein n=1 Tax=Cnephaeus nilssonii TaxID=3371016 RepID=A0AA40LVR7_CNENI|nr:hypothetical protein QTO34_007954 [Eptesicus nilssonii]
MGKRNNSQRKENVESPRKEISENEACNMTEKEFRVMVMEFIHRMDEKINNLCKNQEEMKSDIATIKNTMESFNSRLQEAEDRISELEDQVQKQAQAEQQLEKKIKKQEESLRELRDNMKRSNMRIIGLPEGQEEQQGLENLFEEIMTENFPDMGKIKVTQIGLGTNMNLNRGYGGAGSVGSIPAVQVKQSILNPLKLEVNPNIQSMCNQEKEQIKSFNKFASFIDKVRSLEQQNKILMTKWNLLQQQKMTQSNMDNMSQSYISNLPWQLRLMLKAEFGNEQRLVEYLKNKYEDEINKSTEIDNEVVLIKTDVAYCEQDRAGSHLEGLTIEINFYRQLYEEEICELQVQISDMSVVLSMDNNHTLDLDGIIAEVKAQSRSPTAASQG